MVQEVILRSELPISDEFYNLTQLAEVTLAAGKLSTTNLQQIKEYFRSEEYEVDDGIVVDEDRKTHHDESGEFYSSQTDSNDSFRHNKFRDSYWRWNQKSVDLGSQFHSSSPNSRSSYLSEDEDRSSSYQYSHKIFDRRKMRRNIDRQSPSVSPGSTSPIPSKDDHQLNMKSEKSDCSLSEDIHICPECGKKYSTSSNLARHRQTHRSLEDKKARRCPHCDKVYVSMPAFSMHVRTHNQGCECPHCGKCFSRPWLLQGHIRTHTGEKPFKCSICSKAFADKSNLRAHIQTHSNTKPHNCANCGKSFALKSYLYKHEESSCMRNNNKDRGYKKEKTFKGDKKKSSKVDEGLAFNSGAQEYLDLSMKRTRHSSEVHDGNSSETEHFSRISVIKSSFENKEINYDQYQDQPVDFSAKRTITDY